MKVYIDYFFIFDIIFWLSEIIVPINQAECLPFLIFIFIKFKINSLVFIVLLMEMLILLRTEKLYYFNDSLFCLGNFIWLNLIIFFLSKNESKILLEFYYVVYKPHDVWLQIDVILMNSIMKKK